MIGEAVARAPAIGLRTTRERTMVGRPFQIRTTLDATSPMPVLSSPDSLTNVSQLDWYSAPTGTTSGLSPANGDKP